MKCFENYIDNPNKDANLDEEETDEYKLLRNMYYYLMAHGKIDDTFVSWINKNRNNLDAMVQQAKRVYRKDRFHEYLKEAKEA